MSGYLPCPDDAPSTARAATAAMPFLICHGDADPMVQPKWSTATVEKLEQIGCSHVEHQWFSGLEHSVNEEELEVVETWLRQVLPREAAC